MPILSPSDILLLAGPIVTLLFVLSTRQARISVIIRDNTKEIITIKKKGKKKADLHRSRNLIEQNKALAPRFAAIQVALLAICLALLIYGSIIIYNLLKGHLFYLIPAFVALGTTGVVLLWEMLRAADTIWHELAFSIWHATGRQGLQPEFKRFAWLRKIL